jgi:hypothetical protein
MFQVAVDVAIVFAVLYSFLRFIFWVKKKMASNGIPASSDQKK